MSQINNPIQGPKVATGTYTGNATGPRQITTAFKCSLVLISEAAGLIFQWILLSTSYSIWHRGATAYHNDETDVKLHASDGFNVGAAGDEHANLTGRVYTYWAISE